MADRGRLDWVSIQSNSSSHRDKPVRERWARTLTSHDLNHATGYLLECPETEVLFPIEHGAKVIASGRPDTTLESAKKPKRHQHKIAFELSVAVATVAKVVLALVECELVKQLAGRPSLPTL